MHLTPEAIQEFQEIYRQEYHEDISDEAALELGNNLINFMSILLKPINGGKNDNENSTEENFG